MANNVTASYNNAFGRAALNSTTGAYNTAIGHAAGFANVLGACNVFEGYGAGRYLANGSTALTSPDNSTYLGACTRGYAVGDDNVTVVGHCACACGDNTVSIGNGNVTATHIAGTVCATTICGTTSLSGAFIASSGNIFARTGEICGYYGTFGTVTKGSGSFNINHPLPALSATKRLIHSFIEGPQADNIYSGVVKLTDGSATINIDNCANMTEGTFVALNRCIRTFVNNESTWDPVRSTVLGNIVTVESCVLDSTADVSWMVIGERQDTHMYDPKNPLTNDQGQVIVEQEISNISEISPS